MNQEQIRDEIEKIFSYEIPQIPELQRILLAGEVVTLIPQWRTFSPDCLPDKGRYFAVRGSENDGADGVIGAGYMEEGNETYFEIHDNEYPIEWVIEYQYQFLELP
jgi:hypothetical protein